MKINYLFTIIIITSLAISCSTFQSADFYKAPRFDPNATFKVITLNSNDIISGRIEHYLLTNKFRVISDNSFRLPGSTTAFPNPTYPLDTSIYRNNPLVVNIPYMDEFPADYIIRYQFENPPPGASEDARYSLNISVVNTKTGEVEISYLSEQRGRLEQPRMDRVVQDFVRRLRS